MRRVYRFYVEVEVDESGLDGKRNVGSMAIKDALDEADSHGRLHRHGCGFVSDISVWPRQRRPQGLS